MKGGTCTGAALFPCQRQTPPTIDGVGPARYHMATSRQWEPALPRLRARASRGEQPELGAIGSAELGLVGKPPTVGDIGNGVSAPLCFHLLLAGQQALFPYPTTYRCIGTLEYLMQVAGRNAACSGNNVRSQIRILKVAPDECLDALQMGLLDGRAAAAQRALIGFHRQRQKVHDVLANHLACRSLHFQKTLRQQPDIVGEQGPGPARRVEAERTKAFRRPHPASQDVRRHLQHPQGVLVHMTEFIRFVAALKDKATRLALNAVPPWENRISLHSGMVTR